MVLSHIKYGKAGCDRDITPRLGVCDRDITTLSAHALIGHCLGNGHVTCQNKIFIVLVLLNLKDFPGRTWEVLIEGISAMDCVNMIK